MTCAPLLLQCQRAIITYEGETEKPSRWFRNLMMEKKKRSLSTYYEGSQPPGAFKNNTSNESQGMRQGEPEKKKYLCMIFGR